jgi:hypothetical protein
MDEAALRSAYRFSDTGGGGGEKWGSSLAATYDAALTKDFALAAFSPDGRLGLRWRTRREVINGKGQFFCGSLECDVVTALSTYEVPFQYEEAGLSTAALVRLRLCGKCASTAFLTVTAATDNPPAAPSLPAAATSTTVEDDDIEKRLPRKRRRRHHRKKAKDGDGDIKALGHSRSRSSSSHSKKIL